MNFRGKVAVPFYGGYQKLLVGERFSPKKPMAGRQGTGIVTWLPMVSLAVLATKRLIFGKFFNFSGMIQATHC